MMWFAEHVTTTNYTKTASEMPYEEQKLLKFNKIKK